MTEVKLKEPQRYDPPFTAAYVRKMHYLGHAGMFDVWFDPQTQDLTLCLDGDYATYEMNDGQLTQHSGFAYPEHVGLYELSCVYALAAENVPSMLGDVN